LHVKTTAPLIVERAFFAPRDLQPPLRFRYSEAHPPLLVIETWREGVMGGPASTVRWVYVRS
jgi:hypothetical protein